MVCSVLLLVQLKFFSNFPSFLIFELFKNILFKEAYIHDKTKQEYEGVNVNKAFDSLLHRLGGMNDILFCPPELVTIISLLQAALIEYNKKSVSN